MRYTEIKNLENEEWRPVKGYEGRFEVSNYGRVKSFLTMGNCRKVGAEYAHLLKPKKTNRGYLRVCLRIDGKTKDFSVHRLVVDAFIGIPDGMVVNHIDGCKTNNNLTNLEVVTYTGNLLFQKEYITDPIRQSSSRYPHRIESSPEKQNKTNRRIAERRCCCDIPKHKASVRGLWSKRQ